VGARAFPVVGAMTVSAGVCDLAAAGPDAEAEDLFRLADLALYRAKEGGRNRSEVVRPGTAPASRTRTGADTRRRLLAATAALVGVLDAAEGSDGRHSDRVAALAERLARARGWPAARARELRQAGQLHDVGKIAVPHAVLRKAGPLDAGEYQEMQAHATIGARLLANVLSPEQVSWVRHHHERWDGNGYPDGLAGTAIPDGAALLGLAEAWDAMTASRPYGRRRGREEALADCRGLVGRQFAAADVAALDGLFAAGVL
jgi:HD-GYP domain-containing protein (c-di-GMP phosphodiesterase class II)